tara:strand:- start:726 stop:929 length:204 start_codon:yes stop_codon:yes gene_type:complete
MEYIVWGLTANQVVDLDLNEQPLYTKAKSMDEAQKAMQILKEKHHCYAMRIQVIDGSIPDFKKAINF